MTFDPYLQSNPWLQGLGAIHGMQSPLGGLQSPYGNISGIGVGQNWQTGQFGSPFTQLPFTQLPFSQLAPQTWLGAPQTGVYGSPYQTPSPIALLLPQLLHALSSSIPHQFGGQHLVGNPLMLRNPFLGGIYGGYPFA